MTKERSSWLTLVAASSQGARCVTQLLYGLHSIVLGIGESRLLQVSSGGKLTGTAWWMAPELVPGGKHSDAASEKSDVW